MTATNKWLLTSKSHGDLNRCTPCRGKSDQHDTYASHARSTYARHTLHVDSPHTWQPFMSHRQIWTDPTTPKKKGSGHNPQHTGWPIHGSILSFPPKPTNKAVDLSQAFVDDKLPGLLGPCHQQAIGTFNTCSRGPTHRSLTDTGRGYNLEGADLSLTTLWPF
jgi:hypothetical protein